MKYYIKFVFILAFVSCGTRNIAPVTAQGSEPSFQIFFDNLSPYGFWTLHPDYGYVWIPDAGPDFVPYFTDGHWVYSRFGWTWVSYFDWGWAPFHYGRWDWDDLYGWYWVPGNEWGPAWVIWRRASGYYGWTPMSPGLTVNVHVGVYRDRPDRWIFVPDRDIVRDDFHRYRASRGDNITIINNSTVINKTYVDNRRNVTYITGPEPQEVQRVSGRRISPVQIEDNQRPGSSLSGNRLEIYRPNVRRSTPANQKPSPEKVMDINEVRNRRSGTPSNSNEPNSPGYNRRGREEQAIPQREMAPQQGYPGSNRRNTSPPVSRPEYERAPSSPTPMQEPSSEPSENRRRQEPSPVPQQSAPQRQESAPQQQNTEPSEPRRRESTPQPQQQASPSENRTEPSNNRRKSESSSGSEQQQKQQNQGGSRR